MNYFITLDGGTSNTRVSLVREGKILSSHKIALGARAGIDDKEPLKTALRKKIATLLSEHDLESKDIECVLASGMITSEFGLYTLPHIPLPAGINELHGGMKKVLLPHISDIPFCFIPGVKMQGADFLTSDMIRGEETELMGILDQSHGNCVYVLPGSHSKIIKTDKNGRIESFSTLLSGEMAQALGENTILKGALDLTIDTLDEDYLFMGYTHCKEHGINQSLFKARILKVLFDGSPEKIYSFYMGVVLCGEIEEILSYDAEKVIIGGRRQFRVALASILQRLGSRKVVALSDQDVEGSVTRGMLRVYQASSD